MSFKITLFHCVNALNGFDAAAWGKSNGADVATCQMPCSGMTNEVYLLRAFEAGADAVGVMVCPRDACRYVEGSARSHKRVEKVKKLLDEIGIGSDRLSIIEMGNGTSAGQALEGILATLDKLGPNPAAAAINGSDESAYSEPLSKAA